MNAPSAYHMSVKTADISPPNGRGDVLIVKNGAPTGSTFWPETFGFLLMSISVKIAKELRLKTQPIRKSRYSLC